MLGFEINDLQITWVVQFCSLLDDNHETYLKIVQEPHLDKTFVGITNEKYIYILDNLKLYLDKHCGDAVEKYIYIEDIQ